jgi:hypothetical protein
VTAAVWLTVHDWTRVSDGLAGAVPWLIVAWLGVWVWDVWSREKVP